MSGFVPQSDKLDMEALGARFIEDVRPLVMRDDPTVGSPQILACRLLMKAVDCLMCSAAARMDTVTTFHGLGMVVGHIVAQQDPKTRMAILYALSQGVSKGEDAVERALTPRGRA